MAAQRNPRPNALAITYRPVSELQPYARNPRVHSPEQVAQIAASITEFGFTNPIILDASGTILAGHGRWMAAQHLGMGEVPTVQVGDMTQAQKRAYVIADNKLAMNAGWDSGVLAGEIGALRLEGFELNVLGFSDSDLLRLGDDTDSAMFAQIAATVGATGLPPAEERTGGFAPRRAQVPLPASMGVPAEPEGQAEGHGAATYTPPVPEAPVSAAEGQDAANAMSPISVLVPAFQRDRILAAVRSIKSRDDISTTGEALYVLATEWLAEHAPADMGE